MVIIIKKLFGKIKKIVKEKYKNNLEKTLKFSKIIYLWLDKKYKGQIRKSSEVTEDGIVDLTSENREALTENLEQKEEYYKILNSGIAKDNVKNIAITGGYSSGKSTLIKGFFYNYYAEDKSEYLEISLAEFDKKKGQEIPLNEIELKILLQIFYKVKNKQIPNSRYRKLEKTSQERIWRYLFLVIGVISSYLFSFKREYMEMVLASLNIVKYGYTLGFAIRRVVMSIFVIDVIILLYILINLIFKYRIKKLNICGNNAELESKDKNGESYFDKNIDEFIYFFEETRTKIVVFEDLDRLTEPQKIFTKLRELNNIINNSGQINFKVTFIYALGDSVFKNNLEKVKFFDLIIPIVPIVHYSTSEKTFKAKATKFKSKKNEKLNENFLEQVSLHISDMRLIHNIFNEFIMYEKLIGEVVYEQLFSVILYKNIYLEDYTKLLNKEGILFSLFSNIKNIKNKIQQDMKTSLEELKEDFRKEKEKIQKENLMNLEELRDLYLFRIDSLLENIVHKGILSIIFSGNGVEVAIKDLKKEENFVQLLNKNFRIKYYTNYPQNTGYGLINTSKNEYSFEKLEEKIDGLKYLEREKIIKIKQNNEVSEYEEKIQKSEEKIRIINNMNVKKLIENYNIEMKKEICSLINKEIKNVVEEIPKDYLLLFYLLQKGYINEYYEINLTYLNNEDLCEKDRIFWINVIDETQDNIMDYGYSILRPERILKKLTENHFKKEKILNLDLIFCLLEKETDENRNYLNICCKLFENENKNISEFLKELFIFCSHKKEAAIFGKFIEKVYENTTDFFALIENNKHLLEEEKENILYSIFKFINISPTDKDRLKEKFIYFEEKTDFIEKIEKYNIALERVQYVIEELNLKFKKLILLEEKNIDE